jgi:hypothetical protein
MEHISSVSRYPVTFGSMEELIEADNPVRFPNAFAEKWKPKYAKT